MPTATPTIYTTAHFLNKLHSRRLAGRPNVMLAVRNMMQANINSKNTNTCRDYGYTSTRQDFALRIRDAIKNHSTAYPPVVATTSVSVNHAATTGRLVTRIKRIATFTRTT